MGIKTKILSFANSEILPVSDFLELVNKIPETNRIKFSILYLILKSILRIAQLVFYAYMFDKFDLSNFIDMLK